MQFERPSPIQLCQDDVCQDDFDGLSVPDLQQDGACTHTLVSCGMLSGCNDCAKSDESAYVPVNFIKDEVYQLLAAFEKSCALQSAVVAQESDVMDTSTLEAGIEFELTLPLTLPKRYFRTFWRSAVRRLIEREREIRLIETRRLLTSKSNEMIP